MSDSRDLLQGCPAYIPGIDTSYGYVPSLGAGIAFCALFGTSMLLHTAQFCWKRTWWCSVFSIGCLGMKYPSKVATDPWKDELEAMRLNCADILPYSRGPWLGRPNLVSRVSV